MNLLTHKFADFRKAADFAQSEANRTGVIVELCIDDEGWVVKRRGDKDAPDTSRDMCDVKADATHPRAQPEKGLNDCENNSMSWSQREEERWYQHYRGYSAKQLDKIIQAKTNSGAWVLDRRSPEFHAVRTLWRDLHPEAYTRDRVIHWIAESSQD